MLKEALEYFTKIVRNSQEPHVVSIYGREYADRILQRYDGKDYAEPLEASTLTAMIDYIGRGDPNEIETNGCIIRVVSPLEVRLETILDEFRKRETLIICKARTPEFPFDRWMDQESFIIGLQSCFQPTDDLDLVKQFAGTVEASTIATYGDDGISQKGKIQTGIASKAEVICPNPVFLRPFRTFPEIINQPGSSFVFRVKASDKDPAFKLIEADGGAWRCEAMEMIGEWIADHLEKRVGDAAKNFTVIA